MCLKIGGENMPRVKWCKPVPPPKHIGDLFKRRKESLGLSNELIGELVGLSAVTVSHRINQADEKWDIESIVAFARALRLEADEVEFAVFLALQRGMKTGKWWLTFDQDQSKLNG